MERINKRVYFIPFLCAEAMGCFLYGYLALPLLHTEPLPKSDLIFGVFASVLFALSGHFIGNLFSKHQIAYAFTSFLITFLFSSCFIFPTFSILVL